MLDRDRIRMDGIKLIDEFSKMLERIPKSEETHYVTDLKNRLRRDGKPLKKRDFRKKMRKIVPRWENNYVIAEKGR